MMPYNLTKKNFVLILLMFVYLFWNDSIIQAYDNIFVNPLLSKIKPSTVSYFSCMLLFEVTTFFFLSWFISHKVLRQEIVFLSAFLLVNYAVFRNFTTRYRYVNLTNQIKYADYFIYLFGGIILMKFVELTRRTTLPKPLEDPFLSDKPWQQGDNDLFGRQKFAQALASKIEAQIADSESGAFAIGVNGAWGSGKTSFVRNIQSYINSQNKIVIFFNPWRSNSAIKIIEDFFDVLVEHLEPYAPHLSNKMSHYAKSITAIDDNIFSKSASHINEFLFDESNSSARYDEINQSIKKIGKQIIIFIDDLDRLDKKEVVEVLRLIRNTASFNQVVYVVAYDKAYVLEAVKEFNSYNYQRFLEKIFQFEFMLPKYDGSILRDNIKGGMTGLTNSQFNLIYGAVEKTRLRGECITNWYIQTQRDVVRFLNAFHFERKAIETEINFADFYYLQLIKLKYPVVHQLLYELKDFFFYLEDGKLLFRREKERKWDEMALRRIGLFNERKNQNDDPADDKELFSDFVMNSKILAFLTELEKENIIETVKELFSEKQDTSNAKLNAYKGIVYNTNFRKYFSYSLLSSDLPAGRFEEVRRAPFGEYQAQVQVWLNQGRVKQLLDILYKITVFNNLIEWENHLRILVELGKDLVKQNEYGGNYKEIMDVLNYPKSKKGEILIFDSRENYMNYVRHFFSSAPEPFVFESNLLATMITVPGTYPIPTNEVSHQLLKYFQKYCEIKKEVTMDFRTLHKNAICKSKVLGKDYEIIPEAAKLFRVHFLSYLKGSDLSGFVHQTDPQIEIFNIPQDWLNVFLPSWYYLELYLASADQLQHEKAHFDEYITFYQKYKNNNYQPVDFTFKYLTPNRWTGGSSTKDEWF